MCNLLCVEDIDPTCHQVEFVHHGDKYSMILVDPSKLEFGDHHIDDLRVLCMNWFWSGFPIVILLLV